MQRKPLATTTVLATLVALAGACGSVSNSSDGGGGGGSGAGGGGAAGPAGHAGNGGTTGAAGRAGAAGRGGSAGLGGFAGGDAGHAGTTGAAGASGHGGIAGAAAAAGHGGTAGAAGSGGQGGSGGDGVCTSIEADYAMALKAAQMCTVGTANQCAVQVSSGFFCNCTTFANSGQDTLAAIAARFQSSGCRNTCIGTCVALQALSCVADATSTTGGRCEPVGLLNLNGSSSGGSFAVMVGDEVDITLTNVGPGSFTQDPVLSSNIMTVLQVTIPAGPTNPGGPAQLYRLRATAVGHVQIEIPFEAVDGSPSRPTFVVSLTIS